MEADVFPTTVHLSHRYLQEHNAANKEAKSQALILEELMDEQSEIMNLQGVMWMMVSGRGTGVDQTIH